MSFGLIKLRALPGSVPKSPPPGPGRAKPPESGTPSITNNGWLLERMEEVPRIRIVVEPPG